MNTAMIDHATEAETRAAQKAEKEQAARDREAAEKQKQWEAAENLYWDILCDPKRTTDPDKKAFESARQTLGKSPDDVGEDVALIVKINTADESRAQSDAAQEKLIAAHEEREQWTSGGGESPRNKAVAAVHAKTKALDEAKEQASRLLADCREECGIREQARQDHPDIVRRLDARRTGV